MKIDTKKTRSYDVTVTQVYSPAYFETQGYTKADAKRHHEANSFVIRIEGEKAVAGINYLGINGADAEMLRNIAKVATKIADLIEAESTNS